MLDVHPPHDRMHGFRDFALHLFTITIGLLIALSLEGCVERHHQRQLVHEAQDALRGEIDHNSKVAASLLQVIEAQRKELDGDLAVLDQIKAHPTAAHGQLGFSFRGGTFDNVAWKTAQSTGALAYMSYRDASTYSNIYDLQNEVFSVEKDVTEEVVRAAAFPSTQTDSWTPNVAQSDDIRTHVGLVQMRLMLLSSYLKGLDGVYKDYKSQHP